MFDGSTFTFEGRDDVRCVYQDGEPWFVAQDVAKTMHVKRAEVLLRSLDEDERGLLTLRTLGGDQNMLVVSEPGLYKLILRSQGATTPGTLAHRFCRWVTHEVLPSIRKTGSYDVSRCLAHVTVSMDNAAAYKFMSEAILKKAWDIRKEMRAEFDKDYRDAMRDHRRAK